MGCLILSILSVVVGIFYFVGKAVKSQGQGGGKQSQSPPLTQPAQSPRPKPAPAISVKITTSQEPEQNLREFWLPKDRECTVGPYRIPGGLIYVGKTPRHSQYGYGYQQLEPALIDPSLSIDTANPDYLGTTLTYYPGYSSITPQARSAYLHWLATGRDDPKAPIGYVFLFFYGLERRILVDLADTDPDNETDLIIEELKRLLSIYTDSDSFQGYTGNLLVYCLAKRERFLDIPKISRSIGQPSWDQLPFALRIGLAELIVAGKPIPADWALDWVYLYPQSYLRTPAKRCFEQLQALFSIRYRQTLGEGMIVKPNQSMLKIEYHPASSNLSYKRPVLSTTIPDVGRLSQPINKLTPLVQACVEELDAYSRYLGRNPDQRESMQACALLPKDLLPNLDLPPLSQTREFLSTRLADGKPTQISLSELMGIWKLPVTEKLSKPDSVLLAQLLESLGYGIEPDARFTGSGMSPELPAVVFRQTDGISSTPNPEYTQAMIRLQITALICLADNVVCDAEREQMEKMISGFSALTDAEKLRLRVHLLWFLQSGPTVAGMKKKLEQLPAEQRETIAGFLVTTAQADGNLDPGEVKVLTKVFVALGFPEESLHSAIHQSMTREARSGDEPVVVQPAGQPESGFAIPGPEARRTEVSLDQAAIRRKMTETAAVSSLLQGIFAEEAPLETLAPTASSFRGLSPALTAFLNELATHVEWPREKVEQIAQKLGLMPDGAIESLNELAYDLTEQPLLEGDDPITIDMQIYEEIQHGNES
jgi:tellurite resistance protein